MLMIIGKATPTKQTTPAITVEASCDHVLLLFLVRRVSIKNDQRRKRKASRSKRAGTLVKIPKLKKIPAAKKSPSCLSENSLYERLGVNWWLSEMGALS